MEENLEETKGKKKFFKDKKNIAITILAILLIFSFGKSSEISVETFANLTVDLRAKENIIQANQKKIEDLQKENNILIQKNQNLEDEKNQLYEQNQNLQNEKNQLQEEKQNIENQRSALEQENKNLNEQVEKLKKTSSTKSSTSNVTISTNSKSNSTIMKNESSTIVYITKTGEKYHKSGCSYLRNSKIEMNLSEAKSQGYTPCSRCY